MNVAPTPVTEDQPGAALRKQCGEGQEMSGQVLVRAKQVEVALFGDPSDDPTGTGDVLSRGLIGDTTDSLFGINTNLNKALAVLDGIYEKVQ